MVLILLEALGALLALVLIVWWTMFSGRQNGELPAAESDPTVGKGHGVDEAGTPASHAKPPPPR